MKKYWGFKILKVAACVALAILAFGFVTMHLWNWIVPHLFNGPVITFCQALGILILSKILFGGFRGGWGGRGRCRGKGYWKQRMEEKLIAMTPEEREQFKQSFYGKCGKGYWDESVEEGMAK